MAKYKPNNKTRMLAVFLAMIVGAQIVSIMLKEGKEGGEGSYDPLVMYILGHERFSSTLRPGNLDLDEEITRTYINSADGENPIYLGDNTVLALRNSDGNARSVREMYINNYPWMGIQILRNPGNPSLSHSGRYLGSFYLVEGEDGTMVPGGIEIFDIESNSVKRIPIPNIGTALSTYNTKEGNHIQQMLRMNIQGRIEWLQDSEGEETVALVSHNQEGQASIIRLNPENGGLMDFRELPEDFYVDFTEDILNRDGSLGVFRYQRAGSDKGVAILDLEGSDITYMTEYDLNMYNWNFIDTPDGRSYIAVNTITTNYTDVQVPEDLPWGYSVVMANAGVQRPAEDGTLSFYSRDFVVIDTNGVVLEGDEVGELVEYFVMPENNMSIFNIGDESYMVRNLTLRDGGGRTEIMRLVRGEDGRIVSVDSRYVSSLNARTYALPDGNVGFFDWGSCDAYDVGVIPDLYDIGSDDIMEVQDYTEQSFVLNEHKVGPIVRLSDNADSQELGLAGESCSLFTEILNN